MVPVVGFPGVDSCAHRGAVRVAMMRNNRAMDRGRRERKPDQSNKMPLSWGRTSNRTWKRFRVRVLVFYGDVATAISTANGIEQFTRCGWGAGAMYGIFGPFCRLLKNSRSVSAQGLTGGAFSSQADAPF